MSSSVPFTEKRYVLRFILIATLFFMWAIGVNLNDILIPHLKKAFGLADFQSSLTQSAFFGGYFLMALPAGLLWSPGCGAPLDTGSQLARIQPVR
jgi:MFS transporter, FHS family, L-fucose permease